MEPADQLRKALGDRYRIDAELGRGGMATVYLAEDLRHHRRVALKVLNPEVGAAVGADRFLREIEIAAGLAHPHILPLHDSGEADGLLFFVMPFVEGESLADRLAREGPLGVHEALRITREVADALASAHRHGVIHRDIKPANILLEEGHAVVADFGVARAVRGTENIRLTETGVSLGTPMYMSPEQASGEVEVDGRSDLYSLGCVLYEMLTGERPFEGPNRQAILARKLVDAVPSVRVAHEGVPPAVEKLVTKTLARAPEDRFATAEELVRALEPEALDAAGGPGGSTSGLFPRKRGTVMGVGAAVVVVLGALTLTQSFGRAGSSPSTAGSAVGVLPYPLTAIAVLPFEVLNPVGADVELAGERHPVADLAGGLHATLLTELTQVDALTVIGRQSVRPYAEGANTPLGQIADELHVGSVMRATVQILRGRLSLNVTLEDAATGGILWADLYEESLEEAFALQNRIAREIVQKVGAAVTAAEAEALADAAPTDDPEALTFYLQGEEYYNRLENPENWGTAQQHFERAVEIDPDLAEAHARLSIIHGVFHWFGWDSRDVRKELQLREAREALRLNPDLPLAHLAMGIVHYHAFDYERALEEYRKAQPGMSRDAELSRYLGGLYRRWGRWDEAFDAYGRAKELNPRLVELHADAFASTYWAIQRYAESIDGFEQALALAPELHWAAVDRGWMYYFLDGQADTLRAALDAMLPNEPLGHHLGRTPPAAERARLYLWERQPDSLLSLVESASQPVWENMHEYLPMPLLEAWARGLGGDGTAARGAFERAVGALDLASNLQPDNWRIHAARGLALAGLGRREEALQEVRFLERTDQYRFDAFLGISQKEARARLLAQLGDVAEAVPALESLLGEASFYVTPRTVQTDPLFDPIRDDPRFQALLKRFPASSSAHSEG